MNKLTTVEIILFVCNGFLIYEIDKLKSNDTVIKKALRELDADISQKLSRMTSSLEIARSQCVHILQDVKNIAKEMKNGSL